MRKVLYTLPLRIESRDDDLLIPLSKGGSKRVIYKGAFLLGLGLAEGERGRFYFLE